jgi:hypothetical protein
MVTLGNFAAQKAFGSPAYEWIDYYYRPVILSFWLLGFPVAYYIGEHPDLSLKLTLIPWAIALILPTIPIYFAINKTLAEQAEAEFEAADTADGCKDGIVGKPLAGTAVALNPLKDEFSKSDASRGFEDWCWEQIPHLFERYDLDVNGLIQNGNEMRQLSMNTIYALTKHYEDTPGFKLATTMEELELAWGTDAELEASLLPMTEDQFTYWVMKTMKFETPEEQVVHNIGNQSVEF